MAPAISHALPIVQLACSIVLPQSSDFNVTNIGLNFLPPTTPQPIDRNGVLPLGYTYYSDIDAAYRIYAENVTWYAARERCIEEGARLAVVDSSVKFEHAMALAPSSMSSMSVGILKMENEWVSATTGTILTNLLWGTGEPNDDWECVDASKNPRGLRNMPCNNRRYFVCEIPVANRL